MNGILFLSNHLSFIQMEKRMFLNRKGSMCAEARPKNRVGVCVNVQWLLKVMSMGLLVVLVSGGNVWGQGDSQRNGESEKDSEAQAQYKQGESFILKNISEIDTIKEVSDTKELSPDTAKLFRNQKVRIIRVTGNSVYFEFWDFRPSPNNNYLLYNNKLYSACLNEFKQYAERIYSTLKGVSAGAYTIPFGLRGVFDCNPFDFESSLSLQVNAVAGLGSKYKQESWIDLSLGLGITGVNLTKNNTSGEHQVEEDRTATAFTVSLGALYKPAKMVNIGAFIGWDMLGENDSKTNWRYNKKLWLGLGINVIFNEVKTDKNPIRDKQRAKK